MRVVAVVRGCLSSASGRLTDQQRWNPSCTQNPLESTGGPATHVKPPYAALKAARVPQQPWQGYSTTLRAAWVPLQPSTCCPHLVISPQTRNEDCSRNRGRASNYNLAFTTRRRVFDRKSCLRRYVGVSVQCFREVQRKAVWPDFAKRMFTGDTERPGFDTKKTEHK